MAAPRYYCDLSFGEAHAKWWSAYGDRVREVQQLLVKAGHSIAVDGSFGQQTLNAVRSFQVQHGLSYNGDNYYGVPCPETMEKLDELADSDQSSTLQNQLIQKAEKYLGTPYQFGAEGYSSFDCSGFTWRMFKDALGITPPRSSADQYKSSLGRPVSKGEPLKKGDLLFWSNTGDHRDGITHVAIHIEGTTFIGAQSSTGVAYADRTSNYWSTRYVGAVRFI
ncbi:NlpC/P60 family protein [Halobacillus litoralis]|uniref:C40 family peptidase n=1 Tax=Halobacillus litoralis TaxID=45668 RepID=UPI001CD5F733|nr:NlpC/P60 family protein [Halobacillus litoralis]MCA1021633.1 NlpC/P60 family protein [Halobacillus litoralis]